MLFLLSYMLLPHGRAEEQLSDELSTARAALAGMEATRQSLEASLAKVLQDLNAYSPAPDAAPQAGPQALPSQPPVGSYVASGDGLGEGSDGPASAGGPLLGPMAASTRGQVHPGSCGGGLPGASATPQVPPSAQHKRRRRLVRQQPQKQASPCSNTEEAGAAVQAMELEDDCAVAQACARDQDVRAAAGRASTSGDGGAAAALRAAAAQHVLEPGDVMGREAMKREARHLEQLELDLQVRGRRGVWLTVRILWVKRLLCSSLVTVRCCCTGSPAQRVNVVLRVTVGYDVSGSGTALSGVLLL
jgi:hypothetical protein